jgi:L-alanine-DL-glutamate epimerase-like enolase superfamily enzyme
MVDEGVHGIQDLLQLIQMRGADLVNIKLMKTGGIYPALALAHLAEAAGMPCQVGSMVESAVATMAGAHLSLSQSIIESNELSGPLMFTEDVAKTSFEEGNLTVGDSPGLGIEINESFIKERTEKHCLID